jgi:nucleoside-diphosphate-sugar epimerase
MRLVVFGATGKSGVLVVKQALADGHTVTVFARNPSKLQVGHPSLTVVRGELTDATGIANVVRERDAVISLLGPTGESSGDELAVGMRSIIAAMRTHKVKRLIATSTPSAADPADRFQLSFFLAVRVIKLLQRSAYVNLVQSAEAVRNSGLDWTLVRLPMLTDQESTPPPASGYVGSSGIKLFSLSRNVLSDFLISQLQGSVWIHKAPVISNRG